MAHCDLTQKTCKPCEGGVDPLTKEQSEAMLKDLDGWFLTDEDKWIARNLDFKDFYHTMAFVNAVAYIANQEGHHPDMEIGYNYCHIRFQTHAIGGLSENDFICAAKINDLL